MTIVLVAPTSVQSHQLLYLGSGYAPEFGNGFNVVGLRKHIKGGDGIKFVAACNQFFEVAGEGGWVAGDVSNAKRA